MSEVRGLQHDVRDHLSAMAEACGPRRVVLLLVLQVAAAVSEAAGLALLVPVIAVISGAGEVRVPLLGAVPPWVALALLAGAVAVRGGLHWQAAVTANDVRSLTSDHLRLTALRTLFAARWRFLAGQRRSHVLQSLTTESLRVLAATDTLVHSTVSVLVLVATSVVIVTVAPLLGGAAVAGVVVLLLLARASVARSARLGEVVGEQIDAFGGAISDSLTAARVIRAHDAHERWQQLAADEAGRARAAMHDYVRTATAVRVAMGVLSVCAAIGLVVLGRVLDLDTPRVIALGVLAVRLVAGAQGLVSSWQQFANSAPALAKLRALVDAAAAEPESTAVRRTAGDPVPPAASSAAPLVELREVRVRYPGAEGWALSGVDLAVARGALTVLTGPSGAGKSTLLDVVLGLLPPDTGQLLVDGRPVTDLAGWRSRVGYVPQEPVLVPGTVRDNLLWSLQPGREAGDGELWQALEAAAVAHVVRALPEGLSTWLGETAGLSGGEKQRLTIARALVRRPDLLVLDEATSALDEETETAVLARLRAAAPTTVFVSHRPQVLAAADVLVRLERGRVAQSLLPVADPPRR